MMLSYSFATRITTGYVKGTDKANFKTLIPQIKRCADSVGHPLLLPVLILRRELSLDHDKSQRDSRQKVRELEEMLLNRYRSSAPTTVKAQDGTLVLENIISRLHDYQCKVLWKRPQAWQRVVARVIKANNAFWNALPVDQRLGLRMRDVHRTMSNRLDFLGAKLEGLDNYIQVTLERMNLLRELVSLAHP